MDRRRFLKYAAASVALAGSAVMGYEFDRWQRSLFPPSVSTRTSTETQTTTETARLASVYGRLFFDYNGNGVQDGEEPAVTGAKVQLRDRTGKVVAEAVTDSAGDYKLEDVVAGSYKLFVQADERFGYMCTSREEFRSVRESYDVPLKESMNINVGLMEGFLTLPFPKTTTIQHVIYVDLDLGEGYRDWMGNNPTYFKEFSCRESINNHLGTDFFTSEGSSVVAAAPGKIRVIENSWPEKPKGTWLAWEDGNGVVIDHGLQVYTIYAHLREVEISLREGQQVARGHKIGRVGRTGDFPECEKPLLHFQLDVGGFRWDLRKDPYRDLNDPNSASYWTKDNDPQYAVPS